VSQQTAQGIEIAVIAVAFALLVMHLSRKQLISFRYTVGWMSLCVISLFAGLLIPVVSPLAEFLQIDALTLIAAGAIIVLLAICIQLSISISGLQRQLQRVNEDLAITKLEIEKSRDHKE